MISFVTPGDVPVIPTALQVYAGIRTHASVFEDIFLVFLILGTLVGVVVVAYMLYNAYKYREGAAPPEEDFDEPTLGELPTGGSGGKKLFVSFAISAVIVIGLVAWTYTMLLYVEQGAVEDVEPEHEIDIIAERFSWTAEYPNGESATTFQANDDNNYIAIPEDTMVRLNVQTNDVWHTFGVAELRIKADAIPGDTSETWLMVEDPDQENYRIQCYELCGAGHSSMEGTLKVIDEEEWESQYAEDPGAGNENSTEARQEVAP